MSIESIKIYESLSILIPFIMVIICLNDTIFFELYKQYC